MEFSNWPPGFSGKPKPGAFGGKAGPNRVPASLQRASFEKDCVGRLTERDGWGSVMSSSFK